MYLLYAFSAALSVAICVFAERIGDYLGVIDAPDGKRKIHSRRTPLVGGLAVVLPLALAGVSLAINTGDVAFYGTLTAAIVAHFAIGFVDDHRGLPPLLRLAGCVATVLAVVTLMPPLLIGSLDFSFLASAVPLGAAGVLFTVVCIVGLTNALNMADGQNGVVAGLSLIWALLLFAYAPAELHALLAVLAIGLAITLAFNLRGRVFLGDSGTYGISAILAATAIYSYNADPSAFRADAVMLLFLVPVVDCLRLIATRIPRYGTAFVGDRNHLHHIFLRLMSPRAALLCYWALVGVPSVLALVAPEVTLLWAALCGAVYGFVVWAGTRERALRTVPAYSPAVNGSGRFSVGGSDD